MTTTDADDDVDAEPGARHGWWAGFFIVAALLVLLLSAGLVFLAAGLRHPSL